MSQSGTGQRAGRVFYGWWLLAAICVINVIVVGIGNYTFGVFTKPVAAEFGLSRAQVSNGLSLFMLGNGIAGPLVGYALDRMSTRLIMVAGAAAFGLGLIAIALSHSAPMAAFFIFFPTAFAVPAVGLQASGVLLARWFSQYRGRAMGIAGASTSLGGFILPYVTARLMDTMDWRRALLLEGIFSTVALVALTFVFVRDWPARIGATADGRPAPPRAAAMAPPPRTWTAWEILSTRAFWLITLSIGLILATDQAMIAIIVPFETDLGVKPTQAALLLSLLSASSVAGKILTGYLCERLDKRILLWAVAGFSLLLMMSLVSGMPYWALAAVCCVAGIGLGGVIPVWTTLIAECFGPGAYGSVHGIMNVFMMPMGMIAIRASGEIFDRTRNYEMCFLIFAVVAFVAALIILPLRQGTAPRVVMVAG